MKKIIFIFIIVLISSCKKNNNNDEFVNKIINNKKLKKIIKFDYLNENNKPLTNIIKKYRRYFLIRFIIKKTASFLDFEVFKFSNKYSAYKYFNIIYNNNKTSHMKKYIDNDKIYGFYFNNITILYYNNYIVKIWFLVNKNVKINTYNFQKLSNEIVSLIYK